MWNRMHGAFVLTITLAIAASVSFRLAAQQAGSVQSPAPTHVTWLDAKASGAFWPTQSPLLGLRARYRGDAQILLPLLLTSVRIGSRTGVGQAEVSYRVLYREEGGIFETYEFFATSFPERARGLDRLGFFREAVGSGGSGQPAEWTAYFGAMTTSPEETLEEAKKSLEQQGGRPTYDVVDGMASLTESNATGYTVSVDRRVSTAAELYDAVEPKLSTATPRVKPRMGGAAAKILPPFSFLGALDHTMRRAMATRRGETVQQWFVYYGRLRLLRVRGIEADEDRGTAAASRGWVKDARNVYKIDYRVSAPGGVETGRFSVTAELPSSGGALTAPVIPLAFEYQPRAFLRLAFERTE